MKNLFALSLIAMMCFTAQAQQFRLVHTHNMTIHHQFQKAFNTDSVWYRYSKDRGYDSLREEWLFDHYASYNLNTKQPHTEYVLRYDNQNRKVGRSHYGITFTQPQIYTDVWLDTFIYDDMSGLLKQRIQWAKVKDSIGNYYWRKTYVEDFYYNSKGQPTLDSTYVYYDVTATLTRANKTTHYLYDSMDRLLYRNTYEYASVNAGVISKLRQSHYEYDGMGFMIADTLRQADSTLILNDELVTSYKYDSTGVLRRDSTQALGSSGTAFIYRAYIYNSYGLLDFIDITDSTQTIDYRHFYHWQAYWPDDVQHVAKAEAEIKVYPNPVAGGVVTVQASFETEGMVQGTISDVQGRVLYRWSGEVNARQYKKQIPTHTLSSGMYIISVQNEKERAIRQLVVQ